MNKLGSAEFENLLLQSTRFIDVRAPVEYQDGAVPGAVNLPLLTDIERHEIGITYKSQGQSTAIELGHRLVSGSVREARLAVWMNEIKSHPNAVIYCFRGGLRSQIVQSWLTEAGVHRPIIDGGYKALRSFLIQTLEILAESLEFQVVSGPTGSGKTEYINASRRPFIDLEALAQHRGSAFGSFGERQLNQVNFENALALELLRLKKIGEPILIEDESRQIGYRLIPAKLFAKMQASPKLILDIPIETRVENIFNEYILKSKLGKQGHVSQFDEFRNSVRAISRKLGGTRTKDILFDLDLSQKEFEGDQSLVSNRIWIRKLLEWYYDPYYKFAMERGSKPQK